MPTLLEQLSTDLADATDAAGRSVVAVHARRRIPASGILWRPDVVVATHHTVHKDEDVGVTLPDGRKVRGNVVGRDPGTDLCVLRVDDSAGAEPARLARDPLRVGQLVLAVGRPGPELSAALGAVSAVGPAFRTWQGGQIDRFVRLDVAIHDGFSGGPLVDGAGRVAGVNTSALARAGALTIPVPTVERVVDHLLAGGRTRRGWLGIGAQAVKLPEAVRRELADAGRQQAQALMLVAVEPGSPADRAGLLLGDVVLRLGDTPTEDVTDVLSALGADSVGRAIDAEVLRAGERRTVHVTVDEHPGRR
ncbi:trypsin-like peptidase domain-containing protein [Roseisolibacter sp. H3M3-2]|uniref:S1C family serine protease n=1 Tax=Roseisolibacter sp. H3M3-2 TaxID=3031323 RepID=UPI0023DC4745|nr:trypsin-like peptidase domain-containing protein [Roseisolibacter sp. H3M3-2]MDF1506053.1 trypsin-like peptidase domain-containing protein [Roseisolibacter sp. H3M3-2]